MDTIGSLKADLEQYFIENSIDEYKAYSREILEYAFNVDYTSIILRLREECNNKDEVMALGEKCLKTPIAYVLKQRYFLGRKFFVNNNVLIPRFDTESVVSAAKNIIDENKYKSVLDLCCGSGCIGISIALDCKSVQKVVLSDISLAALEVATKNAEDYYVNYTVLQSDLFENINEKYDLIISNPPYISQSEYNYLNYKVKDCEPKNALLAMEDGCEFYRKIIENAKKYINLGGSIIFEIGIHQEKKVIELLKTQKFANIKCGKDITEKIRYVSAVNI